ncbi:MAG: DUF4177 domain-containing protein [Marinosulfonomonas sp.]|nr:DUF4177 domain-containing protein [Marinosulfonomonas sp.]
MQRYEYKVIPAPRKGLRAKGVRGADNKFANTLQDLMNSQAADGWDYFRTDTLPSEERQGLTGRSTTYQNILVFRRDLANEQTIEAASTAIGKTAPGQPTPAQTTDAPIKLETKPSEPKEEPGFQSVIQQMRTETPTLGGVTKDDPGHAAPVPDRPAS